MSGGRVEAAAGHLTHALDSLHAALRVGHEDRSFLAAVRDAEGLLVRAHGHLMGRTESGRGRRPNAQLRMRRQQRGWSQDDVAENLHRLANRLGEVGLGVDAAMVSRWERGCRTPRPRYVRLLSLLFEASAEELGLVADRRPETAE